MKNLNSLLLFFVFFTISNIQAQITGTITVPSGTYPDLAAAFTALNTQGVGAGGATINVTAAQTCPLNGFQLGSLTLNNSLSAANPLTINGNGNTMAGYAGTRTGLLTSGINDAMIVLSGVDYTTIQNFVFNDLASNTTTTLAMEHAIGMFNRTATVGSADGCTNITITGCTFNMGNVSTAGAAVTARAHVWDVALAVAWEGTSLVDIHRNININNNNFSSIYNGVHFRGATSRNGRAMVVTNNTFTGIGGGSVTAYGTHANYLDSLIYNNNISIGDVAQTGTSYHAYAVTSVGGFMQGNNNTVTLQSGTTTSASYGIAYIGTVGISREINNNTLIFGSFPAITSGSIYGFYATYSGGNNNITFQMNGNIISNQVIPPTTSTLIQLLYNFANTGGANRTNEMNNNIITNLTKANSGTISCLFVGTGNNVIVKNNVIENIAVTNNSASGSAITRGILSTSTCDTKDISNNTISNLSVTGSSTATSGIIRGIESGSGLSEIYNNTISNLSFNAGTTTGSVSGIYLSTTDHNVHKNNIFGLTANQALGLVRGIEIISGSTVNIYNNFLSGMSAPSANSNIAIAGIHCSSSAVGAVRNISFNTINLSSAGPLTSTGALFGAAGIQTANSANPINNIKNNIVNITGTASGDAYLAAVKKQLAGTNGTKPIQINASNNIYNAPYIFGEGPTLSTATNVYYTTGGTTGTADPAFNTSCGLYKTFMGETGTFFENNLTALGNGLFVPSGLSYAQNNATTSTIPTITDDYNSINRGAFADVGALEFVGTALDASGPIISYTPLTNSFCTNSVTLTVNITDVSGVNSTAGTKPRLYFKRSTHSNILAPTNTSLSNGWKFVEASNNSSPYTFNIDFSILFGGTISAGQTIEYFVVAQDLATVPNVGTNVAVYPAGFCPSTAALPSGAFPVSGFNSFEIVAFPNSISTIASKTTICSSEDVNLSLGGNPAPGAQYQWQSSPQGANMWTNIVGATNITYEASDLTASLDFRCILSCGGVPIASSPSTPVSVMVLNPQILSTTPAVSCIPGPISLPLSATANAGSIIKWYDVPSGGSSLATSSTFNTPLITNTTTYYTQASITGAQASGGRQINVAGQSLAGVPRGVIFNTYTPVTIDSLGFLCTATAATLTIRLYNAGGTAQIGSDVTVNIPANVGTATVPALFVAPVSIPIQDPGTYRIFVSVIAPTTPAALWYEFSGLSNIYPYSIGGLADITSSVTALTGGASLTTYYYFYKISMTGECVSPRVPVTASIITTNPTCPANQTVCLSTPAFALTGALPSGGVYSGPGVVGVQFSPAIAGLGTHTITYTICGLSCTFTITVTQAIPTIQISENSGANPNDGLICSGASATLTALASSAYVWSNGATTQSIAVNAVGTYTVTVTNAIGCTGSTSASINVSPPPASTFNVTQPTTCVTTNGAIDLTISTAGTYTYLWSNGATTQDLTGVTVGDYVVTVTDQFGCTHVLMQSLIGPGGCNVCPTLPSTLVTTSACTTSTFNITANGLANLGITYGITFKSYSAATTNPYVGGTILANVANANLTNNGTSATASANIVTAGTNFIYAILNPAPPDPSCRPSSTATLVVNAPPTAGINVTETSGAFPNDGIICQGASATLTGTGGGTYLWSTNATTSAISVSTAGTYTVTVTSTSGCTGTASRIITVNSVTTPIIAITESSGTTPNDGNICQGASATLTCISMGTYAWSTGATTSSITVNTSGTYTVTLTNSDGCTATISSVITVNPLPTALISVTENSITPNDGIIIEGSSATLTASGGLTYRWNTNAITPGITVNPLVNTTYTVTVTNANGCTSTATRLITVVPPPCSIVCAGNQNINLPPGGCEYTLPNFATFVDMCDIYTIVQVAGPVAGSRVAPGTYNLKFELRRKNNGLVIDDCELTLTVSGFANPIGTLTCNDHVNISVDQNCRVTLSADMFLEGGPYACYWDYKINIWPNNIQANAINNVPQGVGLDLPFGNHTYEIVGSDGNKCWGTFTVEDKLPPVVNCNCVDNITFTPVTDFTGTLTTDSGPTMVRVNTFTPATGACTLTTTTTSLAVYNEGYPFNVTATGNYTFAKTWTQTGGPITSTLTSMYIYAGSFDPANPCANLVAFTATGITLAATLTAGVDYIFVFANYYTGNVGNFGVTVTTTSGGQFRLVTNPAWLPECNFKCYDIEIVKRETAGMLYNTPGQNQNKSKLTTPPAFSDCGAVSISFEDRITPSECNGTKLIRDWTAKDANGNKATCSQTFTFSSLKFSDLTPPTAEVNLTCGTDALPATISAYTDRDSRTGAASAVNIGIYADDWSQTPTVIELHEGFVNAYFTYDQIGFDGNMHTQKVDPSTCNIYTTYHDDMFPVCGNGCGGNMKVIRTWKLLDWCTRQTTEYIQVIKAVDDKAPTFDVKDVTVSVSPWECTATYNVERPWELQDNCSKPEEIKWGVQIDPGFEVSGTQPNYRISGLTKGIHSITYWAQDCCGNYTELQAFITVIDASAPVAVAKQNIVVSLTGSGTGADGAGKIYGWQVDNGSYDQCTDIRFEVRRTAGGACGNIGANNHNNNSTYNHSPADNVPGGVWAHPEDTKDNNVIIDTDGGEFVKFCCEDIPAGAAFGLHEVELRVWDDGNMNGVYGDNEIIDGMRDNYNTTWATVRVENKLPPTLVCPANVTVTCDMELNLSIGKDTPVGSVNLTMTGAPKAYDLCSNLDITYTDQWVGQFNDVCKTGTLRRTFKVAKGSVEVTCVQLITVTTITAPFTVTFPQNNATTEWDKCNFELSDARDANNPVIKKPIVNYGQCDIVGENIKIDTFLFEDGACKKWRVEYSYKNWCTGEDRGPFVHWYAFKDEIAPVLVCQDQMFAANPNAQNPNGGCEAQVALEASASDALVCAEESWVKWQMYFDGWANGTVDRLASSFVNKSWNGIWVAQARLLATGAPNPVWAQLQAQHPGLPFADLVYVTYIKPTKASGETVKIPVGTGPTAFILDAENISHKVLWKVTDGCGNVDQCESTVMVVDKKAPTPYCVGISTALMQSNPEMVELWAIDFDKGSFDNCTPISKLAFSFDEVAPIYSRINDAHFYKKGAAGSVNATAAEYAQGKAYRWLPSMRSAGFVWTVSGDYNVKVSVWDEAWNTDFCNVDLKIRTKAEGSRIISGNVSTFVGTPLTGVNILFNANIPEYPKSISTDQNGNYSMYHPVGISYSLSTIFNGDYLNGVSTLDLVLIQRHILGMQVLDNEYKVIAADANNDGRVTASDLSELRKLILGIKAELPNSSWRFPVKNSEIITSPINFKEELIAPVLESDLSNQDFVAVKIGDVNGSVQANLNDQSTETRSNNTVAMTVAEAAVVAGDVLEIPVTASNFADVAGFQFTMNLKGASFISINSGSIEMNANNVGILANGNVTMSYATSEAVSANEGDVLFTLVVRANQATTVSEMITLNSAVTKSESYNSDLKVGSVNLSVRTAAVASIELFQNEPNPFRGQTTVSFEMPNAGAATLSVYDMTGKLVVVRNIDAAKGLNSEIFTKEQLGVSGVMYYTLESGDFTATKKMIIVE